MQFVKPLDPYSLQEVDEPYRDRLGATKGHAIQARAISDPMNELTHVIDFFLGDGSSGSGQDPDDLTQVRKSIQAAGNQKIITITATGSFDPVAEGIPLGTPLTVLLWGAGGGGCGRVSSTGSGGSGGGFSMKSGIAAAVTTVTIGNGGVGVGAGTAGGNGTTTSFGAVFSATGGMGGAETPQAAGTGVGGDLNMAGGSGCDILSVNDVTGLGGASPFIGIMGAVGPAVGAKGIGAGGAAWDATVGIWGVIGGPGLCIIIARGV